MIRLFCVLATLTAGMAAVHAAGSVVTEDTVLVAPMGDVQGGRALHRISPNYPAGAKRAQVSGVVKIEAWVGKDGRIAGAEVLSGPKMLRKAALDAVLRWQYEPAIRNGKAIDRIARITITFLPLDE
jgi:TonB family protein